MNQLENVTPDDSKEEAMRLLARYQARLYSYIVTILGSHDDAEDLLQDVSVIAWQKFHEFERGTDFRAWIFQIAWFRVRQHIERKRRSGSAINAMLSSRLNQTMLDRRDDLDAQMDALRACMDKLDGSDRQLMHQVYGLAQPVPTVAATIGRQATSVYRSLRRIRERLLHCIDQNLASEARR